MLYRRPAAVLSIFAASVLAITPPVSAGCLSDWLFGRQPTYSAALPVVPLPAQANYQQVTPTSYAAQLPTMSPSPYAAQSPVYAAQMPAYSAPTPAYSAQMPAYGTMAPLPTGYAGQYSSLYGGNGQVTTTPIAPAPAPVTSYYGSGNVYPPIQTASGYYANYGALQPAPVRTGGLFGGIRGFFGNLFGTNYRTSYYRAPVTYYRPLTTVDPVSGSTVTVQRPCTSYQYQVQRMPYVGLQPAAAMPTNGCETGYPYAQAAPYTQPVPAMQSAPYTQTDPYSQPSQYAPSQEGFVAQPTLPPSGNAYGSQFPATPATPPSSANPYGYAPTAQPLTGAPTTAPFSAPATQPNSPSDYAPMEPPQMKSYRIPETSGLPEPPSVYARPIPAPPTTWSQPQASDHRETSAGRTAARPAWGFKKISWNSNAKRSVQRATFQSDETQQPARIAEPSSQERPAPPAVPRRDHSEYDSSGWRSQR